MISIHRQAKSKASMCVIRWFSLMLPVLASASGNDDFVRSNCETLGYGIHQKVENYKTKDEFTDLVIYSLFCGVELYAYGERELEGYYTQEVGYEVKRHWGYLKYTPTYESVKRRAVETGNWSVGTWKTRAAGLNNIVVLDEGPEIVNGSWSYCTEDARDRCRHKK